MTHGRKKKEREVNENEMASRRHVLPFAAPAAAGRFPISSPVSGDLLLVSHDHVAIAASFFKKELANGRGLFGSRHGREVRLGKGPSSVAGVEKKEAHCAVNDWMFLKGSSFFLEVLL